MSNENLNVPPPSIMLLPSNLNYEAWLEYTSTGKVTFNTVGPVPLGDFDTRLICSLSGSTWLPFNSARCSPCLPDRNILIILDKEEPGHQNVLAHLNFSAEIRLDLALLEGQNASMPTVLAMEEEHCRWTTLFKKIGLTAPVRKFEKEIYRGYQAIFIDDDKTSQFLKNCMFIGPRKQGTPRLEALSKMLDVAKKVGLPYNDITVKLALSTLFVTKEMPAPASNVLKPLEEITTASIYNYLSDVRSSLIAKALAVHLPHRFLTKDQALINLMLNSYLVDGRPEWSTSYFFPNITKKEKALFDSVGIIVVLPPPA